MFFEGEPNAEFDLIFMISIVSSRIIFDTTLIFFSNTISFCRIKETFTLWHNILFDVIFLPTWKINKRTNGINKINYKVDRLPQVIDTTPYCISKRPQIRYLLWLVMKALIFFSIFPQRLFLWIIRVISFLPRL